MEYLSDRSQGIFCNRTLNLRRIGAIGYDMDYTLVHYRMQAWEQRAYIHIRDRLVAQGWPVEHLTFDPDLVMRGLIIDHVYGNVVKANRFGFVKQAYHGTRPLAFEVQREIYERTAVDLHDSRWYFLNTLFSISEACMYMQLVDLLDEKQLPVGVGYTDLFRIVRRAIDETHMEGRLKAEIIAHPEEFVEPDPDVPMALLDQKESGKKVLLITNSEWSYAAPILSYAFDAFLPEALTWKDLFDIAIVGAKKPEFFSVRMPSYEVVTSDGLLREHYGPLMSGHVYVGGNALLVEESLGLTGEEILYVGDHIFTDVNVSKSIMRWRTALIVREIEDEVRAAEEFSPKQRALEEMMLEKERLEAEYSDIRLALQRKVRGYGPQVDREPADLERDMRRLRERLVELDSRIAPLAEASSRLLNPYWGMIMRAGNDKSLMARQIERYADVYTSRVSNFLPHTPFIYLRSHRGSLPHDAGL